MFYYDKRLVAETGSKGFLPSRITGASVHIRSLRDDKRMLRDDKNTLQDASIAPMLRGAQQKHAAG